MLKTQPAMKLSHDEEAFLRHWIFDEAHYQEGQGAAKRLQIQLGAAPAELALLIAAAIPSLADQEAISAGPSPTYPPRWPWHPSEFQKRLAEARAFLAERRSNARRD
jgi:hypothetical protein